MRKRYCRICKNLADDTNRLLSLNRLIAEAGLSLEELADSISHYVVREKRKVIDKTTGKASMKWVRPKSGRRRLTYSAVEVGLHRDQCLRGFVAPKIEKLNVAKPNETAVERADRLYAANERVHHFLVEHIMSKQKPTENEIELLLRFNDNMMKNNQFRAKVAGEIAQQSAAQAGAGGPTNSVQIGVMLPSTFGRSPDQVQEMIDKGMQPLGALPAAPAPVLQLPSTTAPISSSTSTSTSVVDSKKKDVN